MKSNNNSNNKGSNSRSNSRRRNSQHKTNSNGNKPKTEELESKTCKEGNINDYRYYYNDENVLSQIMNFSFNQYGGIPVEFPTDVNNVKGSYEVPEIMSILVNPSTVQTTQSATTPSGVTTAALRNYLVLSGSNAKTTVYAPQDVQILMFALGEIIKVSMYCTRAFAFAYTFNYRNRTFPDALYRAMGINPNDFKQHLAQYRITFNTLQALASRIPFPAGNRYFAKCAGMFANIYADSDNSALAQNYMLVPYSTWLFDETYDTNGSGLHTQPFVNGVNNFSVYLTIYENMINALLNSTSLNTIYSDVLRLAQNGKLSDMLRFNTIEESLVSVPIYNTEVESWLHNAICIGFPLAAADQYGSGHTPDNDLSSNANKNTIFYNPQWKSPSPFGESAMLDFRTDQVTPELKVNATRLSARWSCIAHNSEYYTVNVAILDAYIVAFRVWNGTSASENPGHFGNIVLTSLFTADRVAEFEANFSKFDWAPLRYYVNVTSATDYMDSLCGDLNYYTLLNFVDLRKMYDYECLALYQID